MAGKPRQCWGLKYLAPDGYCPNKAKLGTKENRVKKVLLMGLAGLSLIASGADLAAANTNNAATTNTNAVAENPAKTAKSVIAAPKRVKFVPGQSEAKESVSLKAGETKRFVVRGRIGQIFMVDADSKDLEIKMVKGKDSAQLMEPGRYDSTLIANGDFVFQVKNTSKGEVQSSLKILISDTGISTR
jgi:hypothetical protein